MINDDEHPAWLDEARESVQNCSAVTGGVEKARCDQVERARRELAVRVGDERGHAVVESEGARPGHGSFDGCRGDVQRRDVPPGAREPEGVGTVAGSGVQRPGRLGGRVRYRLLERLGWMGRPVRIEARIVRFPELGWRLLPAHQAASPSYAFTAVWTSCMTRSWLSIPPVSAPAPIVTETLAFASTTLPTAHRPGTLVRPAAASGVHGGEGAQGVLLPLGGELPQRLVVRFESRSCEDRVQRHPRAVRELDPAHATLR